MTADEKVQDKLNEVNTPKTGRDLLKSLNLAVDNLNSSLEFVSEQMDLNPKDDFTPQLFDKLEDAAKIVDRLIPVARKMKFSK